MKILFISNLFPDRAQPNRGSDNAVLLRTLSTTCEIRVLSPRPSLFPFGCDLQPCASEEKFQPVYLSVPYVPKVGSQINHRLMANSLQPVITKIRQDFSFDVVLTSWIYPDTCATALVAKKLRFPFVAIAQGSDVHQYLNIPARKKIIQELLPEAKAVITRSGDLARLLAQAGLPEEKLKVVYNGIDRQTFRRAEKQRKNLGLPENIPVILFVGNFLPIKNIGLLVRAHAALCHRAPGNPPYLILLGSGPLARKIMAEAKTLGTEKWLLLPGRKPPEEVARYMQSSDVLCLSSDNEGFPNVILEALACGLPVVSTRVGGIAELLSQDFLGRLTERGNVEDLTEALAQRLAMTPETERIAQHGSQFSWERAGEAYREILLLATRK